MIKESSAGDPDAAKRRLEVLQTIPRLDITDEVESLAAKLIAVVPLPPKAQADALHIAAAAVHHMETKKGVRVRRDKPVWNRECKYLTKRI